MEPKFGIVFKVEEVCIPKQGGAGMHIEVPLELKTYSALQLQQAIKQHSITAMLTSGDKKAVGISGVFDSAESLVFNRLCFSSIYGQQPNESRASDLAYQLGLATVDTLQVKSLMQKINDGLDGQLGRINELASIIAPMLILQGQHASCSIAGVDPADFKNAAHATLFRNHTETWMTSLLIEQGLDPAGADPALQQLNKKFPPQSTSFSSPSLR
tara:strand:- start:772 stop:1413 length:642 start_codon:yes stop_codon:yes gene_type:complete